MQYWPASKGKEEVYDGITVSYNHEEQLANFVIRNFKITKEGLVSCCYIFRGNINFPFHKYAPFCLIIFCFVFLYSLMEERERGEDFAPVSLYGMALTHLCNYL